MLDSAKAVQEFTRGVSLEQYRINRLLRRGVEREMEILGEAAHRLTEELRSEHPEIPWRRIIGPRNLIAHGYDAVDDERVWRIATEDAPSLVTQLEGLVPPVNEQHD